MLIVVGASHLTAPLPVRERLAVPADAVPRTLASLRALPNVDEALLLSTCNRVEVYAATSSPEASQATLRRYLAETHSLPPEELARYLYDRQGDAAIRHLLRVTASLDSMVVGEPQILGQVKDAFGAAERAGTSGPVLGKLLPRAFAIAKRVRSDTGIARHPASVAAVAVDLARRIFSDLAGRVVLLVGAGKMSDLASRRLRAAGASEILVVNRSPERAAELAHRVGGRARPWEDLAGALAAADVVVCSTGATAPVLTAELVGRAVRARKQRPLFLIDIAVPRDVEADAARLPNVYLYDIDDLSRVVAENRKERMKEAEAGERIVEAELAEILAWARSRSVVPTIKDLRAQGEAVAQAEVERALAKLGAHGAPPGGPEALRPVFEALAAGILNKLLHAPSEALKEGARRGEGELVARAARELFGLDDGSARARTPPRGSAAADPHPAEERPGEDAPHAVVAAAAGGGAKETR